MPGKRTVFVRRSSAELIVASDTITPSFTQSLEGRWLATEGLGSSNPSATLRRQDHELWNKSWIELSTRIFTRSFNFAKQVLSKCHFMTTTRPDSGCPLERKMARQGFRWTEIASLHSLESTRRLRSPTMTERDGSCPTSSNRLLRLHFASLSSDTFTNYSLEKLSRITRSIGRTP